MKHPFIKINYKDNKLNRAFILYCLIIYQITLYWEGYFVNRSHLIDKNYVFLNILPVSVILYSLIIGFIIPMDKMYKRVNTTINGKVYKLLRFEDFKRLSIRAKM